MRFLVFQENGYPDCARSFVFCLGPAEKGILIFTLESFDKRVITLYNIRIIQSIVFFRINASHKIILSYGVFRLLAATILFLIAGSDDV